LLTPTSPLFPLVLKPSLSFSPSFYTGKVFQGAGYLRWRDELPPPPYLTFTSSCLSTILSPLYCIFSKLRVYEPKTLPGIPFFQGSLIPPSSSFPCPGPGLNVWSSRFVTGAGRPFGGPGDSPTPEVLAAGRSPPAVGLYFSL